MCPHCRSFRVQLLLLEELQDDECPRLEVTLTVTPPVASWSLIQETHTWLDAQSRVWFWITGGQGAREGRGYVLVMVIMHSPSELLTANKIQTYNCIGLNLKVIHKIYAALFNLKRILVLALFTSNGKTSLHNSHTKFLCFTKPSFWTWANLSLNTLLFRSRNNLCRISYFVIFDLSVSQPVSNQITILFKNTPAFAVFCFCCIYILIPLNERLTDWIKA